MGDFTLAARPTAQDCVQRMSSKLRDSTAAWRKVFLERRTKHKIYISEGVYWDGGRRVSGVSLSQGLGLSCITYYSDDIFVLKARGCERLRGRNPGINNFLRALRSAVAWFGARSV